MMYNETVSTVHVIHHLERMMYMANAKKLPSGNWRIRVFIGEDENGKKKVKSFTAPTRWQCEKLAYEFVQNNRQEEKTLTVGDALDGYIKIKENVLSPSTIRGYGIIRRTRLQTLMDVDVHELDSFKMQMAINADAPHLTRKSIAEAKNLVLTVQRSRMYLDGKEVVRDVNKTELSTRQLTIPKYIYDMIQKVPHKHEDEYIIKIGYQTILGHFQKLMKEQGVKMTFHDLRHLNASVMLMLGVPDKYAMERGGWSTTSTLKSVYQHTFSEERKQADTMIDTFFNDIIQKSKDTNSSRNTADS